MGGLEQEGTKEARLRKALYKVYGPLAVGSSVAVALVSSSALASNGGRKAETEPRCVVSSLVFEGAVLKDHPYGRFYGNANCRNVMRSVLGDSGKNKTWYRWDIDVNGRHIVRKGGPITQIRLPENPERAEISASYTIGYNSLTSTTVEFNPSPHWPEADVIVAHDSPEATP